MTFLGCGGTGLHGGRHGLDGRGVSPHPHSSGFSFQILCILTWNEIKSINLYDSSIYMPVNLDDIQ